jgi:hypothetical protein
MHRPNVVTLVVTLGSLSLAALGGCNKGGSPAPASSASASGAMAGTKPAAEPSGAGVTFARETPRVGQKHREASDLTMKLRLLVDPGNGRPATSDLEMRASTKQTEEVLALNAGAPAKVKVTFDSVDETTTEEGREQKHPSPVSGKTYVVESRDGKLETRDAEGKLAPRAEATEVEKHFRSLGEIDPFLQALPTTPLTPGTKVESLARALEHYVALGADGMKVSDVTATFKEKSGDEGVFAVALTVTKEEPTMRLSIALAGDLRVSTTTGEPTSISISGPIAVTAAPAAGDARKPKPSVAGSGKMTLTMRATAL